MVFNTIPLPLDHKSTNPDAKSRWRRAYFVVSFSITLAKNRHSQILPTSQIVDPPYSVLRQLNDLASGFRTIDPAQLTDVVENKDMKKLRNFGGVNGLAKSLQTSLENGITGVNERRSVFGSNTYEKPPLKGLLYFVTEAFKDTATIVLLGCAALVFGFSIKEQGLEQGWHEGGSIIIAVLLMIGVSAGCNFRQERQIDDLSKASNNIKMNVIRQGRRQRISIFDIVVGDVVILSIGDQIPADGLFISGHSMLIDESCLTGESEHIDIDTRTNPFLLSGSKVADGYGLMLVLSVGMNTSWGKMMSSIAREFEQTPLQVRLNKLASSIKKAGLVVAFLFLMVMLIRYFTGNTDDENGKREYNGRETDMNQILLSVTLIFSVAVTMVLVVAKGLPLVVIFKLAYSMKGMMRARALVRKLSACESMGSVTAICTDKTGTLTKNEMTVTKFWPGLEYKEGHSADVIAPQLLELLHQGISFNTHCTVFKSPLGSGFVPEYFGSPTEKAILSWAVEDLDLHMDKVNQSSTLLHIEPFSSTKRRTGASIRRKADNTIHVHWKGAAEMILALCSKYYESNGSIKPMDSEEKAQLEAIIEGMAASGLRCIAFAHKQHEHTEDDTSGNQKLSEEGLTLLGIVGIKDPCRPGAKNAIETCRAAGVKVKMITGDNVFTAKAIAAQCGILESREDVCEGEVVEGAEFRNYTDIERLEKVDNIRVMARSSPYDKLLLVQALRRRGHVVAITGKGTSDAPALHEADIGLSMGIQGTEVAKESSDIVILDDNFATIVVAAKWGRCIYKNIQKFIQFQLTVNAAALVINFIAAVSSGDVPLTAVQLLWVNLIMDTLGALALATERPRDELLNRPPVGRVEPLITNIMWRNIFAQSVYQITVLLILQFKGKEIVNVDERVKNTIIFNTFVLCQVFNEFNSRELEKKNIFRGILSNRKFLGIIGMSIILHVGMVEFLKDFANTERLNWVQWGICIGIAAMSWPIGWLTKLIPLAEKPFSHFLCIHGGSSLEQG